MDTEVSQPAIQLNFDYDQLPKEAIARAIHAACQIKLLATVTVVAVAGIGEQLQGVHAILAAEGKWTEWLEKEFAWTEKTAREYMDIHGLLEANPDRGPDLAKLGVKAAAALARRSTPPEIRRQALDLVRKGRNVTSKMVREMLEVPRSEPPPKIKRPKAAATPEDLALIVVGIVNIHAEAKAHEPGTVAAAVSPLLRRRYREDVAALVEWLDELVEDLGDGTDAQAAE